MDLDGGWYTITFPQGSMRIAGGRRRYGFGIRINAGSDYGAIRSLAGEGFVLMLAFSHGGELPGEAFIRVSVGERYAGGELHCCAYHPQVGSLAFVQAVRADADGYVTIQKSSYASYAFILPDADLLPEEGDVGRR